MFSAQDSTQTNWERMQVGNLMDDLSDSTAQGRKKCKINMDVLYFVLPPKIMFKLIPCCSDVKR